MDANFTTPRADEYCALLATRLPDKTLRHVYSVAAFLLTFAQEAGISEEQAVTAGLLHDLCKADSKELLREKALRYGLSEHLDNPNLLHGPVGAAECRATLEIEDEDVLEAIAYHTTGKGKWNAVGRALYLADFSEPLRTMPEAATARKLLTSEGFWVSLKFVAETRWAYGRDRFGSNEHTENFIMELRDLQA